MSVQRPIPFDRPLTGITIRPVHAASVTEKQVAPETLLATQLEIQANIRSTLSSIATQIEKISNEMEALRPGFVELTLKYSEAIIRTIFQNDVEIVKARLQKYLDLGIDDESSTHFSVWVHPECVKPINEYIADSQLKNVSVDADRQLAIGDCRIESPTEGLIARLENHIESARNQILLEVNSSTTC